MIVTTTENVPGHRVIDVKGQVFGLVVRSRGLDGNKSEVEGSKHEDDADVCHQPFPKVISEEGQISADHNGDHDRDVEHESERAAHE